MGKKSKGGGKKKQVKEEKDGLPEVDKEYYEIQIADLTKKFNRLETKCTDLEAENEAVRANMDKLDEDRGDVISHLKRILQRKVDEVSELTERIDALQMAKETEGNLYKEKIKNMENDFKHMHEQLSSEIKLLNGKLNSLEEFRAQRDELMSKFDKQEQALEEQERRHDQQLLDMEQSYLVRKERMKEEMEQRLLKLSLDFQKATQMRIASTTQMVIKENIAVNNQLNILVSEWKRMSDEIDYLKDSNKSLALNEEMCKKESQAVERKNIIQNEIIMKLSKEEFALKKQGEQLGILKKHISRVECELSEARRCERVAIENLGLAKQHLHALAIRYNDLKVAQNKQENHSFKLEAALSKASNVVKQVLNLTKFGDTDEGTILRRAELLKTLENILDLEASKIEVFERHSIETILADRRGPAEKYKSGDLGIVPPKIDPAFLSHPDADHLQDMTWERHDESGVNITQYVIAIEKVIMSAKAAVKEIQHLPEAKTIMMKKEVSERRSELLEFLNDLLNLSLLQTPRPQQLPSLDSILLPDGLLDKNFGFTFDKEIIQEYRYSEIDLPCGDETDSEASIEDVT